MNNALMVIGALLIAALTSLFAVPYFVDWNGYRGVFEAEASRLLGRDVRVGGNVNLRLLPSPYVRFERVRIADITGATGEPLFRADSFTMWLSVPPLLKGVMEARQIELKRPILSLAVDAEGRGNWSSLKLSPGALPFVPNNVTLQSLHITDGAISMHRVGGELLANIDAIEGDLESDAIAGPYRFKGTANWHGDPREVRFATAAQDPDGSVRFKTIVRVPATAHSYTIEGRAADIMTRPQVTGEFSARLALQAPRADATSRGATPSPSPVKATASSEHPVLDIKSQLVADGTGMKFTTINANIENLGQPQILNGDGEISWIRGWRSAANLSSRWLDLDRLVQAEGDRAPLQSALDLADWLMHALPTETSLALQLAVDQVNLGGDAVAGLSLAVSRNDGPLRLETLQASLPSGARLQLSGTITGTADRQLKGKVDLHGPSFAHFVNWAARDEGMIPSRHDGPFVLHGQLALDRAAVEFTDATADIAGNALEGSVRYTGGEHGKLALALSGRQLDVGALEAVAERRGVLADLGALWRGDKSGARPAEPRQSLLAFTDIALTLHAGELIAGGETWRDVDADVTLEARRMTITRLKAGLGDAASFEVDGEITEPTAAERPRGNLHWLVASQSADTLVRVPRSIRQLLPQPIADTTLPAVLFPLRLAGTLQLGGSKPTAARLAFDGQSGRGRLAGELRVDDAGAGWRDGPVELRLAADTSDGIAMLAFLTGSRPAAHRAMAGRLQAKATGTPAKGLITLANLDSNGLALTYSGQIALPSHGTRRVDGHGSIASGDVGSLLSLAGLGIGAAAASLPVVGGMDISTDGDTLRIVPRGLTIAGAPLDGTIALSRRSPAEPLTVAADLATGPTSLQRLLTAALDARPPAAPGMTAPATGSLWPELAFDLSPLAQAQGEITLHTPVLSIAPGLTLDNVRMKARLAPGRIDVERLDGRALAGAATANISFVRQPAGVNLSGTIDLSDLDLKGVATITGRHQATGKLTARLSFDGKALSPAALIANMAGKGRIDFSPDATITGFAPEPVAAAADAITAGKTDVQGEALLSVLSEAVAGGRLALGPRHLDFDVAGGAVRIPAFTVDSSAGRTTLIGTIDLASLKLDQEIRIEAKARAKRGETGETSLLPPVSVVYVGPLADVAKLEPRITVGALERELVVRRMERNVEELERLRREDEERARQEQERRREAEKARAAAAAGQQQGMAPPADPSWTAAPVIVKPDTPAAATTPPAPPQPLAAPRSGLSQATPPRLPVRKSPPTSPLQIFQGAPN
jgi:uncharacterized protein involved in outer membrane biogenesis